MKTFLNRHKPLIVPMILSGTVENVISEISRCKAEGADGICLCSQLLQPQERTEDNFLKIIKACGELPLYAACYQRGNVSQIKQSDEELADTLLLLLKCGATLIDVRGDFFDENEEEFTMDISAVQKQADFIKTLHKSGGEVIMSTHVFKFIPKDKIIQIATEQEKRGADIIKIVVFAETEEQVDEYYRTILYLKSHIKKPILFLLNGKDAFRFRLAMPLIYNPSIMMCVENSCVDAPQPTISCCKQALKIYNR